MYISGWSRRRFMNVLGLGAGVFSPLAANLAGWAQGAPKKRLVIIQHPYGSDYPAVDAYWPVPLQSMDREVALTPAALQSRRVSEVIAVSVFGSGLKNQAVLGEKFSAALVMRTWSLPLRPLPPTWQKAKPAALLNSTVMSQLLTRPM